MEALYSELCNRVGGGPAGPQERERERERESEASHLCVSLALALHFRHFLLEPRREFRPQPALHFALHAAVRVGSPLRVAVPAAWQRDKRGKNEGSAF